MNTTGASAATKASPGSFVAAAGSSSQTPAAAGFYASGAGAIAEIVCPGGPGGSFSYGAASACRAGSFTGFDTVGPEFATSLGSKTSIDLDGSGNPLVFSIRNDTNDVASQPELTDLTLLSYLITGSDAPLFSLSGFTPGMVLHMGDFADLSISFAPGSPGSYSAMLTFLTDQGASFASAGQSFSFLLTGTYATPAPAPASLGLIGTALAGLAALRRRWRRRPGRPPVLASISR